MAESPLQRAGIRRITPQQFGASAPKSTRSRTRRTISVEPREGGTFSADELGRIVPPPGARAFKIVRMMGGRYTRDDNPLGLGTEGPFDMSDFPSEDDDLSGMEDQQVTKVIFDVAQ